MDNFKAIVVEDEQGFNYGIKKITLKDLSSGSVLVRVAYSSINYKDMLALQPHGGVIRDYPMIPGIDASGVVVESSDPRFTSGDEVLITGLQLGMSHTGGLSEYVRVPADWLVRLPARLSMKQAMIIGTAGFTAALSIDKLSNNGMVQVDDPEVLVTGATGGVGSIAVQMLAQMGFTHINALVRKDYQEEVARKLGATSILRPVDIAANGKPLDKQRFDFIIDTVGGEVASSLLSKIYYGGSMTMCGNAGGIKLDTNVLPFILRGVSLFGIDSVNYPIAQRARIWEKFTAEWNVFEKLQYNEVGLDEVPEVIEQIKNGHHIGRTIVNLTDGESKSTD